MTRPDDHRVTIERRGRSHKATCSCSWQSHAWNELRPAEADAWHHVFGDSVIVDVSAIPDERSVPTGPRTPTSVGQAPTNASQGSIDKLVGEARRLARRPSPYTGGAAGALWGASGQDHRLLKRAVAEIEELLATHDRRNSGAADSEWLELITAKRLLLDSMDHDEAYLGRSPGRALL